MSDILFDSNEVLTVLCENLNVQGHDLLLDSPTRRRPNGPEFRRALVHDQGDGLTLNFAGDYPGGVTIQGGNLNLQCHDLLLDSPARRRPNSPPFRRALVHDQSDGLTLNFGSDYPGGVTIGGKTLRVGGDIQFTIHHDPEALGAQGQPETASLEGVIKSLRAEILRLTDRVVQLEKRP